MEELKKNILIKLEKILDEELSRMTGLIEPSSSNESASVSSRNEIECEIVATSTPIKHRVPIDCQLTPVKGLNLKITDKLIVV